MRICFKLFGLFCLLCLAWQGRGHAQVVVSTLAGLDFGSVEFAISYAGNIQLGTDGNIGTTGFGMVAAGNGNAGAVRVTQPNTGMVEFKCSQSAELDDPTATALNITNIEIAVNSGVPFGSGTSCQGTAIADPVAVLLDMDALGDPTILIGGEVVISGTITLPSDRIYSTIGPGEPIQLSLVIQ